LGITKPVPREHFGGKQNPSLDEYLVALGLQSGGAIRVRWAWPAILLMSPGLCSLRRRFWIPIRSSMIFAKNALLSIIQI